VNDAQGSDTTSQILKQVLMPPKLSPAAGLLGLAVGAASIAAISIGVMAIGRLAIGQLALGRVRIRKLEVDDLSVRRLHVVEQDEGEVTELNPRSRSTRRAADRFRYSTDR